MSFLGHSTTDQSTDHPATDEATNNHVVPEEATTGSHETAGDPATPGHSAYAENYGVNRADNDAERDAEGGPTDENADAVANPSDELPATPVAVAPSGGVTTNSTTSDGTTPGSLTAGSTTPGSTTPESLTTDGAQSDGVVAGGRATGTSAAADPLLDGTDLERRWQQVQASFVDGPRQAVEEADALVSETVAHLTSALAARKSALGGAGSKDGSDTESLRIALRGYRKVFRKLLEV